MICEGVKLVGILTERDALKLMAERRRFLAGRSAT